LLVLVVMEPAKAEFKLMTAVGPGQVVAGFKAFIAVLPREVAWIPSDVERRALQKHCRQAAQAVVRDWEEAGCGISRAVGSPTAGVAEARSGLRLRRQRDFVAAVE